MKIRIKSNTLLFLLILFSLITPIHVLAGQEVSAKGISVAPAIIKITVTKQNPVQSATVEVTNNQNATINLRADLRGVDEDNGMLSPTKPIEDSQKHIISLNKQSFTLAPNESTMITITVTDDTALKPGASYFSLVVTELSTSSNTIGVQPAVGAGIFITKEAGAVRQLALSKLELPSVSLGMPSSINIGFTNAGNVQLVPRGIITLSEGGGTSTFYGKGVINTQSVSIFPGKNVFLMVPLQYTSNPLIPHNMHLTVQYRFDGSDDIKTVEKKFLYIPTYLFGLLIIIMTVVTSLIFIRKNKLRKARAAKKPEQALPQSSCEKVSSKKITINDGTNGHKITVRKE